ncbi:S66 peptidase family protein [Moheibacter sediminis]|uniref:Muramoyltetrapeptide carboxypeptidase n=1 Tax=Moheibacter sediminis TaxID=1434700 RepID=A0A1W1ZML8_9FLAO|nr:LD-carboxypeptidase [Moheibacter sediminis]SMC49634.1 muramoyltetrapeptide carboxypeptidase [Moheibacter sediminis]
MKPEFLKPNDKIAIVAPSGRIFPEEIEDGLNLIKSWGLTPILGKNLFQDHYNGYHFAGTDEQRISDFQNVLDDDKIKAIWCARGGYGAVKLLDNLNWDKFLKNPKWIIGYSDITAIHNHINNSGIETVHGITTKKLNTEYNNETFLTLEKALFGKNLNYEIPAHLYNQRGNAKGKLAGGNLSIIYSLAGSKSFIDGNDLILFIEDWNENWYHIDRMMTNLKRSGLLNKIKGMIVGSFTQMDVEAENPEFHSNFDQTTYEVIKKIMNEFQIPIAYQFPAGHIGDNRALIFGSEVSLEVNENSVILKFN